MAAPGNSIERHHLRTSEIHLLTFKEEYMPVLTERLNAYSRPARRTAMRAPAVFSRSLPVLFAGDQPVCTLLLYNMHKVSKKSINDMLLACGQSKFTVDMVFGRGQGCSARVTCDNIASSTLMQCDALLNKIYFEGKGSSITGRRYVKIRPFIERKDPSSSLVVRVSQSMPPVGLRALCLDPVLATIIKYLYNDDKLALVTALEGWRTPFSKLGTLQFDSGHSRYQTARGFDRMQEDAQQFYFSKITISESWPMEMTDFQRILNIIVGNQAHNRKPSSLMSINLRGVVLTSTALETLTRSFSIKDIVIGKTTGFFERTVSLEGVERLSLYDNPMVRLSWAHEHPDTFVSWLRGRPAETLRVIKLNSCAQIRIEPLFDFIQNNVILGELSLTDCRNIDRNQHIWQLPEEVFNSTNELKILRLVYIKTTTEPLEFPHMPVLSIHAHLTELSLRGSRFVEQNLQNFLNHAPALRDVDFRELQIAEAGLDFSALQHLTSVRLPYHQGIDSTLESLATLNVREILIENSLGRNNKRNRPLNLHFALNILSRVPSFCLTAVRCKIYLHNTTRSRMQRLGVFVTPRNPIDFYDLFEIKM